MMRYLRSLLYFLVGVLLSSWAVLSYADTPVTQYTGKVSALCADTGWTVDKNAAGSAAVACRNVVYPASPACTFVSFPAGSNSASGTCAGGGSTIYPGIVTVGVREWCTQSNSAPVGGVCSTSPPCPAAGTTTTADFWGLGATIPDTICAVNGCTVTTSLCGAGGADGNSGKWFCSGGTYTGQACTGAVASPSQAPGVAPSEVPPDSPYKKCIDAGQSFGTVNGVVVCTAPTNVKNSSSSSSSGATNSSTTTTTKCDTYGNCWTQTNNNGSTTTTTSSGGKFCEENPNSVVCQALAGSTNTGTGTGTGGGGGNNQTDCDKLPNSIGCSEFGTPGASGDIEDQKKNIGSITPTTGGAGNCPASVHLPRGAEFSYAPMCQLASGVRPVVIGIAWLLAGFMVFGWFKS